MNPTSAVLDFWSEQEGQIFVRAVSTETCSEENSSESAASRAAVVSARGIPVMRNIAPVTFFSAGGMAGVVAAGEVGSFLEGLKNRLKFRFMALMVDGECYGDFRGCSGKAGMWVVGHRLHCGQG